MNKDKRMKEQKEGGTNDLQGIQQNIFKIHSKRPGKNEQC